MPGIKYRLGERIGAGGMAEVFYAITVGTGGFERSVAVKRVLPKWSKRSDYAQMFVDEARIMAALRHRNIVGVSDFARDDEGRLFLVMELVEGVNLTSLADTGPVPLAVAIYIVSELLRGLGHMHECLDADGKRWGLVHRDLSANNVLLSWDGGVKLSDFGLAKAYASDNSGDSDPYGTVHYMSPEQVGGGPIDRRTDLFAVGVILYELLTGTPPFFGAHKIRVMSAILERPIKPPSAIRPEVPADLEAIVLQLLERDREQRPANADAVIDALERCADASHLGHRELVALLRQRFLSQDAGDAGARRVTQEKTTPKQVPPAIWVNYSAGNAPAAPVLQEPVELPAEAQEPAAQAAGCRMPLVRAAADHAHPVLPADDQVNVASSAGSQAPLVHAAADQEAPGLLADAQAPVVLSAGSQVPVEHVAADQAPPSPLPPQPQNQPWPSCAPPHQRFALGTLNKRRWLWAAALLVGSAAGLMLLRDATAPMQRSRVADTQPDIQIVQERQPSDEDVPSPAPREVQPPPAQPPTLTPVTSPASARTSRRDKDDPWTDDWWMK